MLSQVGVDVEEDDESDPYRLTDEEFDRLWYEDPRVKKLRTLEVILFYESS